MQMFNNLDMEKEVSGKAYIIANLSLLHLQITEMMGNPAAFQEMLQFLDGQPSNTKVYV